MSFCANGVDDSSLAFWYHPFLAECHLVVNLQLLRCSDLLLHYFVGLLIFRLHQFQTHVGCHNYVSI